MRTLIAVLTTLFVAAVTLAPATANERAFSEAELHQLLAPVALYPDGVLSNILIAATYPVEVVRAARWSRENSGLEGEAAIAAVADRDWDPSVKALVAFPDLLARMDEDLDWTQRLGEAFMFEEALVMDAIQGLRNRAYAAGNLKTDQHVRVVRETSTIAIQPVHREVVYVPYYDTRVVYGQWWAPAYPPVYWSHPVRYHHSRAGFYYGRPVRVTPSFYYSSFYWPQRHVVIVNVNRHSAPPQRWRHTPRHRAPVHHGGRYTQPRRDAHREWANTRRETFPRGLRGPSPNTVQQGTPQRQVRTHRPDHQRPSTGVDTRRETLPRGMRGPSPNTVQQGTPQRQVRTQTSPRGMRGPSPAPSTPRAPAPMLDVGRPNNQFESRGIDRSRLPTQRQTVTQSPRMQQQPRPTAQTRSPVQSRPAPATAAPAARPSPPAAQTRPARATRAPAVRTESVGREANNERER